MTEMPSEFAFLGLTPERLKSTDELIPLSASQIAAMSSEAYAKIKDDIRENQTAMTLKEAHEFDVKQEAAEALTRDLFGAEESKTEPIDAEIRRLSAEIADAKKENKIAITPSHVQNYLKLLKYYLENFNLISHIVWLKRTSAGSRHRHVNKHKISRLH